MKLSVENGSFYYKKSVSVFENINFEVKEGEILAILGPNGAGKTTMLRCITGMLKWKTGKSLMDNEDIASMQPRKLWSKMAYVPQAKSVSSAYTALEMVLLGRSSHLNVFESPGQKDVDKALEVMRFLEIAHLADKKCSEVSGGELQMILIARALASEPKVLVLDEPESNLDFKNQLVVLNAMSNLAAHGMTCIFNTHYPAHALQRAQKSLILSKGGAYVFGDTVSVVTETNIRRAFGVDAIIGEIETPGNLLRNVVPINIVAEEKKEPLKHVDSDEQPDKTADRRCIAAMTIIANNNEMADKINGLLHEYNALLIGRMGMPYRECGLYIINVTLDGKENQILELSHKLGILPGISVKTTFAKGDFDGRGEKQLDESENHSKIE
ncbi:MAG: ATP-binding cassette domain-containing protein [Lachnospiraceae bacterium]|nr:ATP-binding cassette domain-containing protein [Lachnospiraceae bacterium]